MLGVRYLSPWTPKASALTGWAWCSNLNVEQRTGTLIAD